jgi:hypothetical protein
MKYLIFLFLLAAFTMSAEAQPITITEPEYINMEYLWSNGITGFTAQDPTTFLYLIADSGANQVWDFTRDTYLSSTAQPEDTIPLSEAPLANDSDFSAATNVIRATKIDGVNGDSQYFYYKWTSAGAWYCGTIEDSDGVLINRESENPPGQDAAFPLTYRTSWQTISKGANEVGIDQGIVDGWGTLITPGKSSPALRVKTLIIDSTFSEQEKSSHSDTTYLYEFLTAGMERAFLFIYPTITLAYYQVPISSSVNSYAQSDGLNLFLSPNPATSTATVLSYTLENASPVQIELMDVLGRSVRMLENGFESAGEHSVPIDPSTLSAGTYFVRVEADGASAMQKLIVQ